MNIMVIRGLILSFVAVLCVMAPFPVYSQEAELKGSDCASKIELLISGAREHGGSVAGRTGVAADLMAGSRYEKTSHLDSVDGPMKICLDAMDEFEFIEYAIAAAKASLKPGARQRDFISELQGIRYRRGENNGFTSRLRYASDWIADNCYRNGLQEVTYDLPGNVFTSRTLDNITRNKMDYPALSDSVTLERMEMLEMGYRAHKVPYMKRETIGKKNVVEHLRDNDIIVIVDRSADFLDIGFIRIQEGRPFIMHASRKEGVVKLEKEPLSELMKLRAKEITGYRVLRLKD